MESNELIPVHYFCATHSVELSFVESLQQFGLVEMTYIREERYFKESQLEELEKFVRLHYDLEINIEGIEAISHLLQRIQEIQARNMQLQNRLGLYEDL